MCHKLGMTHKQPQPLLPAGRWFQAVASQLPHSTARCEFQGLTSLGLLAAQRPPLQELGFQWACWPQGPLNAPILFRDNAHRDFGPNVMAAERHSFRVPSSCFPESSGEKDS